MDALSGRIANLNRYPDDLLVRIRIPRPVTSSGGVPSPVHDQPARPAAGRPALGASSRVALGILASRISGLARERIIGHFFGVESIVADAFRASIRIPNLLSNLFGEGVISASFVTVYSRLRAHGQEEEANHVAAAVFGILSLVCSVLVLLGVLATPLMIDLIAPGFHGDKRDLTIHIVRILFPSTGLLVLGAWCLGVLNSHRRFLLSYMAPVVLNVVVIAVAVLFQYQTADKLVITIAWGYVVGSLLTLAVQLPRTLSVLPHFRPVIEFQSAQVRAVLRNFGPIFLGRGVVQISSYIDQMIASSLPTGALAALGFGQVIAILPVSLFSMSISAAELPELSSAVGSQEEVAATLRKRLSAGLRRIAFLIVPCAVAFLAIGDVLVAALYQGGRFTYADAVYVWCVLAGSAVGLLATSLGRLYSSVFYALHDTRTPLRFAVIRVIVTTLLGLLFAFSVPKWLGIDSKWGVAGLTASAGIAGWVEFTLLRRALAGRIGGTPLPASFTGRLWAVAAVAGASSYALKSSLGPLGSRHPLPLAVVIIPLFCGIYLGGTALLGVPESKSTFGAVLGRLLPR